MTKLPGTKDIGYIVPQTHWDREWYEPFQTFRMRLVKLLDAVLPMLERDPSYARYLLDGQTVVLGGLITSTVNSTKDKVPVIGDLPLFGRFFQSQSKTTVKNNLMIFVTATIVDPAGSRVHSDDELPFAQNTVPTQPAANVAPVEKVQTVVGLP